MPDTYILGYIKNGEFHRFYEGMKERLSDLQIMQMNLQTAGARWEIRKSGEVYKVDPVIKNIFESHFPGYKVS